jgi:hypothetical protein
MSQNSPVHVATEQLQINRRLTTAVLFDELDFIRKDLDPAIPNAPRSLLAIFYVSTAAQVYARASRSCV